MNFKSKEEKILAEYSSAIVIGLKDGLVIKKSLLPYSKEKIKIAYYTYIDTFTRSGNRFTPDDEKDLIRGYWALNSFVDDEIAEQMSIIEKNIKFGIYQQDNPNHKKHFDKLLNFVKEVVYNGKTREEIVNYIQECYKKYSKNRKENKIIKYLKVIIQLFLVVSIYLQLFFGVFYQAIKQFHMVLEYPFNPFYLTSILPSFFLLWLFCYLYYKTGSKPNWKLFNSVNLLINDNKVMNLKFGIILLFISLFSGFLPH